MSGSSLGIKKSIGMGTSIPMSEISGWNVKRYHAELQRAALLNPNQYMALRHALMYKGTVLEADAKKIYPSIVGNVTIADDVGTLMDTVYDDLKPKPDGIGKLAQPSDALVESLLGKNAIAMLYSGIVPMTVLEDFAKTVSAMVEELKMTAIDLVLPEQYLKGAVKKVASANAAAELAKVSN